MTEREGSQRERAATEAVRTGPPLRIGTRGSALARSQTGTVIAALAGLGVKAEAVEIVTTGDRSTAALTQIGGTGVFVSALRDALLEHEELIGPEITDVLEAAREAGADNNVIDLRDAISIVD